MRAEAGVTTRTAADAACAAEVAAHPAVDPRGVHIFMHLGSVII
jgi:hypothetical protein